MTIWENSETHSKMNLLVAIIVCLAIFLPLLGMLGPNGEEDFIANEMRNRAPLPTFSLAKIDEYPDAFTAFFNDTFGFRNQLISLNGRIRYTLFDISGSSKVVVGKKGWLFYTGDNQVEDYQGLNPLSLQDMEQWRTVLEAKQKWLAEQGIAYMFVVAPSKQSIYPEYYTDRLKKVSSETHLDQLVNYLEEHSSFKIVDLRKPIQEQKQRGLLYYPVGTHWTSLGAFLGYQEMMKSITRFFPQVKALSFDDLNPDGRAYPDDGLASMLGVRERLKVDIAVYQPNTSKVETIATEANVITTEVQKRDLPRAVIFRDSFTDLLWPFLSENFSYARYLSTRWYKDTPIKDIISESKPDIVIEELVERGIKYMQYVTIASDL